MARFNYIQNNFSSGELGPSLIRRTDLEEYKKGLQECINFYPTTTGTVKKRPGTRILVNGNYFSGLEPFSYFIPFSFSKEESYLLVVSPSEFRAPQVYSLDGLDLGGVPGDSLCNAPFSMRMRYDGVDNTPIAGRSALSGDGFRYAQAGNLIFVVHSSGFMPPIIIMRIFDPADSSVEFKMVNFIYLGDIISSLPPSLTNNTQFSFLGSDLDPWERLPFLPENVSAVTLTPSGTSGNINLTASASYFTGNADLWNGMIIKLKGASAGYVRITGITSATVATATVIGANLASTSATNAFQECAWNGIRGFPRDVAIYQERLWFAGTSYQKDTLWGSALGNLFLFSDFGTQTDEFPTDHTIGNGEVNEIQWMSVGQDFQIGTLGKQYIVSSSDSNKGLTPTTVSFIPQTSNTSSDTIPARIENSTFYVSGDGKRLYEMLYNEGIRSYESFNISLSNESIINFNADPEFDFSNFSIRRMTYQPSRNILWIVTSKNQLIGLTIDRNSKVAAWHKHEFGGSGLPQVLDAICLPDQTNKRDILFLSINRTEHPADATIEALASDFIHPNLVNFSDLDQDIPHLLDCSLYHNVSEGFTNTFTNANINTGTDVITVDMDYDEFLESDGGDKKYLYTGTKVRLTASIGATIPGGLSTGVDYFIIYLSTTTCKLASTRENAINGVAIDITSAGSGTFGFNIFDATIFDGFSHLQDQVVDVLADGYYIGEKTIDSSGRLTLATPATEVVVGYRYDAKIKLLPLEAGAITGTAQGQVISLDRITLAVDGSYGGSIGPSDDNQEEIEYLTSNTNLDSEIEFFTGDIHMNYRGSNDTNRKIQPIIKHNQPFPFHLLAVIMRGVTNE